MNKIIFAISLMFVALLMVNVNAAPTTSVSSSKSMTLDCGKLSKTKCALNPTCLFDKKALKCIKKTVKTAVKTVKKVTPSVKPTMNYTNSSQNASSSDGIYLNSLYSYGTVTHFEYATKMNVAGQQVVANIKETVSSESVNGVDSWFLKTETSVSGTDAVVNLWIDKGTLKCLKSNSIVQVMGKTFENPVDCPKDGPNSGDFSGKVALKFIGEESVTVPLGTFNAKKYEAAGATFWAVDGKPLPVKVAYAGISMELVQYS